MKRIAILLATIVALGGLSTTVNAAPHQMPDGNIFDAEFYAANNPDVVAVFGTDETQLYQHYLSCGTAEGRLPYEGYVASSLPVTNTEDYKARLDAVKALYPQGSVWDDNTEYKGYYACHAFAVMVEELVFDCQLDIGQPLTYKSQVYPGCVYCTGRGEVGHIGVITDITEDGFIIAEGNCDDEVNYTRKITWNKMMNGIKSARAYTIDEVDNYLTSDILDYDCYLSDIAEYNAALALYESDSTLIPSQPSTYRVWSCTGYIAEPCRK